MIPSNNIQPLSPEDSPTLPISKSRVAEYNMLPYNNMDPVVTVSTVPLISKPPIPNTSLPDRNSLIRTTTLLWRCLAVCMSLLGSPSSANG